MSVTKYDLLVSQIDYGDRVLTSTGFTLEFNEYTSIFEDENTGKIFIKINKPKKYGFFKLTDEIVAIYKRTCKLKRKK